MNKELTLEQMKRMSSDEIINVYRNGYRLSDRGVCRNMMGSIMGLGPATCPASIVQGTLKPCMLNLSTAGTPPYTCKFYVDGVVKVSLGGITVMPWGFGYVFAETPGPHVCKGELTDSCATGAKVVSSDPCTITIVAPCPDPVVALTIPA